MNPIGQLFIKLHTKLYRMSGGKIGSSINGAKIVLLTTVGNKSGKSRTVPLMCFEDGGKVYIVASAAGADTHPAWYKNLSARPEVTYQLGPKTVNAKAVTVDDAERDRLFELIKKQMPQFAGYEKKTTRKIPLVRLDPQ